MYSYLNGYFKIIITRSVTTVKIIALHYFVALEEKKKQQQKHF